MTETLQPEIDQPPMQADYFGFQSQRNFLLPDGMTYVTIKKFNEGDKAEFQKATQSDVVLERNSGNARMKVDQAAQRHQLIRKGLAGWNLARGGQLVPFDKRNLDDFLKLADPSIIELIEKEIRKDNPWLLAEMTVEEIDKEIENLNEMRKVAEERERGN